MLLTVERLVLPILLNHHVGHHRDVGLEAIVGCLRHDYSAVTLLADALGIDVLLDFVLYWQLGELLTDVFADFDQQRVARAMRAPGLGRIYWMLYPAAGQMLR